jgi:hypothetical protein
MRRRELLLAAAGLTLAAPAAAHAAAPSEGGVLVDLMTREQRAKLAYAAAIKKGGPAIFAGIRANESDHADALTTELAAIGLGRPLPPRLDATSQQLADRADAESAIKLEDELVDAYVQSLPHLQDAKIAMTVATILASHAQHRLLLGLAAS